MDYRVLDDWCRVDNYCSSGLVTSDSQLETPRGSLAAV